MGARLLQTVDPKVRADLRKAIASDIYRTAQRSPMSMTADGGQICIVLAELILRRVEEENASPEFGGAS